MVRCQVKANEIFSKTKSNFSVRNRDVHMNAQSPGHSGQLQANVTPIPKGPSSSFVANYRPISITTVLSKVFERLVSVRLRRFMERSGVLPTTQVSVPVSVTVMHFMLVPYTAE